MERRRAELEEKRRKLEEMKRAREERMTATAALRRTVVPTATTGTSTNEATQTPYRGNRQQVDDLLNNILGQPTPSIPSSGITSRPGSSLSGTYPKTPGPLYRNQSVQDVPETPASTSRTFVPETQTRTGNGVSQSSIPEITHENGTDQSESGDKTMDFIDAHEELFELPQQTERVTYSRGVQTANQEADDDADSGALDQAVNQAGRETEDDLRKRLEAEFELEKERLERQIQEIVEEEKRREEKLRVIDLSEEERLAILETPEFSRFLEDSGKIIQRALSDGYDYIRDYAIGGEDLSETEDSNAVKPVCVFSDDRWTVNRSITGVDWSPKFPELVAASYNKNPQALQDPDGVVAVWNMHLRERPEFVFHSQSDVLSVAFSPVHPNLVFGGTYAGQVLMWDTRSNQLPVLKTPLSAGGHTYPIYSMKFVGSHNAHNLVTASTDGTVCTWMGDMLTIPQETLELSHQGHYSKTREVSVTCLDFPDNETGAFWVGTEEGGIYVGNRFDRAGQKSGINAREIYKAHDAPVTSVDFHPLKGPIDFSDIFLSTSVDWTVKLWRARPGSRPSNGLQTSGSAGQTTNVPPIYSFEEANDYVYDARWHPSHPAVFGSVSGDGQFEIWNLNADTEVPVSSFTVGNGRAINKLAWEKRDGRHVALGASDGLLHIYDVGSDLANPKENEWHDFQRAVQTLKQAGQHNSLSNMSLS